MSKEINFETAIPYNPGDASLEIPELEAKFYDHLIATGFNYLHMLKEGKLSEPSAKKVIFGSIAEAYFITEKFFTNSPSTFLVENFIYAGELVAQVTTAMQVNPIDIVAYLQENVDIFVAERQFAESIVEPCVPSRTLFTWINDVLGALTQFEADER